MSEGVVIDLSPVTANESTHKEQERRLRLVEVCDEHADNLIVIARTDDNLCAGVENLQMVSSHPIRQGLKGFFRGM